MDLAGKRLLLVGGAGLVGSHILDQLLKEDVAHIRVFDNFVRGTRANIQSALTDPRVEIVEGDTRNMEDISQACQGVSGMFLLSALWLLQCAEDPRSGLDVNVQGNFNAIEAARSAGVERIVFSSSASVYGNALVEPMGEDHPLNNRTFYGATKVALEQMLRSYHEMYKLPYVSLRYFNIYGPRQDYKNAYVSVIMKVLDRIDKGQKPIVMGDGSQSYDFIYVKDVARSNIVAMKSDVVDESFNICTGKKTSIRELVQMLLELSKSDLEIEYQPASQVFVTDRVGDLSRAKDLLKFEAQIKLEDGLLELMEWRAAQIRAEDR